MKSTTAIELDTILAHLDRLVAADSSDPVATMTAAHPAMVYAAGVLREAGCVVECTDLGYGCVNLLAVRGEPTTLLNCHLDTVLPNPNWTRDPFVLSVEGDRVYGLGACDIKGAAACMLAVAQASNAPIAVLFTSDEEAGKGMCVETFLGEHGQRWSSVVVAEPTGSKCVLQHRGFTSFELEFVGTAGHTSGADASTDSAIHKALAWGHHALELARPGEPLDGARFNIGLMTGGTASNVIAASSRVRFGFRPPPTRDAPARTAHCIEALHDLLPDDGSATWTDRFIAPALVHDPSVLRIVEAWGIEVGEDVDFWTEAALFAAGGLPSVVLGPGDIAQAHTADEYVSLDQLSRCADAYARVIASGSNIPVMSGGAHAS